VSVVFIVKGTPCGPRYIDEREVERITAYLFHTGGDADASSIRANHAKAFLGSKPYATGFSFDDTEDGASPTSLMRELVETNDQNGGRIFPYLGGDEVNDSPTHQHYRYVINFGSMSEEECRGWPDLMKIVEDRVKPGRLALRETPDTRRLRSHWWQFGRHAKELYAAIEGMPRVLVCSQTSKYRTFAFVPSRQVFDQKLVIIAAMTGSWFALLSSRVHEAWALFFGSTMKDDPVYTPSDCFETFPFPEAFATNPAVEHIGAKYYEHRADLMVKRNEGLTRTYNRFHDPHERAADILKLRELHVQMDRAVLDAYGWTDIQPAHDFREQLDESIRLTWDDDTRYEVLARLLELNRVMAEKEAGDASKVASSKPVARKGSAAKRKTKAKEGSLALLGVEPEEKS
jgi:hypothetical protein